MESHMEITCKGWVGKVVGDPKIMDDEECQKKIQNNWPEENSSQQPGIWLRASEENAVLFFVKYWGLSKEKQKLLKKDNQEKWTSLSWECTNKKDLEDGEKIIVSCNSTVTQSHLRK
ncbi:hypothetical protein [Mycoplasma suis]|nr:hypothetical protein [Mycoplasma suis]